jgi:hypothetical protein
VRQQGRGAVARKGFRPKCLVNQCVNQTTSACCCQNVIGRQPSKCRYIMRNLSERFFTSRRITGSITKSTMTSTCPCPQRPTEPFRWGRSDPKGRSSFHSRGETSNTRHSRSSKLASTGGARLVFANEPMRRRPRSDRRSNSAARRAEAPPLRRNVPPGSEERRESVLNRSPVGSDRARRSNLVIGWILRKDMRRWDEPNQGGADGRRNRCR